MSGKTTARAFLESLVQKVHLEKERRISKKKEAQEYIQHIQVMLIKKKTAETMSQDHNRRKSDIQQKLNQ